MEEGGEQWNECCVQGLRSLAVSPDGIPKMLSLGTETEKSVENFLRIVDFFLPSAPDLSVSW